LDLIAGMAVLRASSAGIAHADARITSDPEFTDLEKAQELHRVSSGDTSGRKEHVEKKSSALADGPSLHKHSQEREDVVLPSEEEKLTLRRVAGNIPMSAWLVVIVELAERFSYYGTAGPFVNYIQRPLPLGGNGAGAPPKGGEGRPGALGKGQQASTGLTTMLSFLGCTSPILGAILADAYWGKLKTIFVFVIIGGIGHVILVGTAAPAVLQNSPSGAFAGFVVSIIILGFATGAIKANVSPLIAEQIPDSREFIKTLPSGEKVIVDPNLTIQRVFMYFYLVSRTPCMENFVRLRSYAR